MTVQFGALPPVGQFLRWRIRELGYNQAMVAQLSGISQKHLSGVIVGHSGLSAHSAAALGRVLGVAPVVLVMLDQTHQLDKAGGGR